MAVINPPAWMQAGSYPARNDRLALSALMAYPGFAADEATPMRIRQGVKPSYQNYQMRVRAAATPNMTVIVSGGFCYVDQHDTGGQGTYLCANDGDVVLTVQPAGGAGQYRKDCVVASVYDAEYAGSVSEWRLEVIQGAYAASAGAAVRPTLPPNAQLLADIAIGPSQTSVTAANISDVRNYSVSAGGVLPVASNVAPPRPHPGQVMYLTDTDNFVYGDQSGTVKPLMGQWTTYVPTLTNITLGSGNIVARYRKRGDAVDVAILLNWGSTTSNPSGIPTFSLPVTPALDNMRWTGGVLINPPGVFRTGISWAYYNTTTVSAGAISSTGSVTNPSGAGITMASGGWIAVNISYAVNP